MRKRVFIIIGIMILVLSLIIFCLYQVDSIRFKFSYEYVNMLEYNNGKKIKVNIPYDNKIQYLDEKELLTFLQEGTGIVYFGYNTCPWCRNAVPILIDTVKKNNIDTIYYADIHKLNISSIREELYSILESYLEENETGEKALAVPDVYFIKEGKIIGHHIGTVDSYYNPYNEMSDSEKKELSSIYEELIKELK